MSNHFDTISLIWMGEDFKVGWSIGEAADMRLQLIMIQKARDRLIRLDEFFYSHTLHLH